MKTVSIFNALGYGIKSYFKYFKYILFFTIIFGLAISLFFIADFTVILELFKEAKLPSFFTIILEFFKEAKLSPFFTISFSSVLTQSRTLAQMSALAKMSVRNLIPGNLLLLGFIVSFIASQWINFSLIKLSLRDLQSDKARNKNIKFISIIKFEVKLFIKYIVTVISYSLLAFLGFVLTIIPGFLIYLLESTDLVGVYYWALISFIVITFIIAYIIGLAIMYTYIFAPFVIVDKKTDVYDSLSLSNEITYRSKIKIFILDLLVCLIGFFLVFGGLSIMPLIYQHKHYLGNSYIASFLTLAIYSFISITFVFIGIFSFTYIYQTLLHNFSLRDLSLKANNKDVQ